MINFYSILVTLEHCMEDKLLCLSVPGAVEKYIQGDDLPGNLQYFAVTAEYTTETDETE